MSLREVFTAEVPLDIIETKEFSEWAENLEGSDLDRLEAAIEKIELFGIITNSKSLGDGLYEKKWKNGLRMYFSVILGDARGETLLLLGSRKGRQQERAVAECRQMLRCFRVYKGSIRKID